jgi:hypothetical protein
MCCRVYKAFLLAGLISLQANGQSVQERVTSVSNVGTTINSIGLIGNAFRGSYLLQDFPSVEYPRNSGIECAFQGGLWVGGLINGNQIAVTTGYVDAPAGYSTGSSGFEFTASSNGFTTVSSLLNSRFFNPNAISHEDFRCRFTDRNILVPGTSIPVQGHLNPLGIDVEMETYNWNFGFADFYVIINLRIINRGSNTIDSMYAGYLVNGVVRNTNITPAGFGGTQYFNKGGNAYEDSLYLSYDFDATGDVGATNVYSGQKFLGASDKTGFRHPSLDPNFKNHYNCWLFRNSSEPLLFEPGNDVARYEKMTQGLNFNACWRYPAGSPPPGCSGSSIYDNLRTANNRSNLNVVGPFAKFEPGDTVHLAYALVFGPYQKSANGSPTVNQDLPEERAQFLQNAVKVQATFNGEDVNFNGKLDEGEDKDGNGVITRYILPNPPNIPQIKIIPKENSIDIYWTDFSEQSVDPVSKRKDFEGYRIYISQLGFDVAGDNQVLGAMRLLKQWDNSGNALFLDNGFSEIRLQAPVRFEDDSLTYAYKFTITNLLNGWQHAISVTAFDTGDDENNVESLESSLLTNLFRAFPGKPANESLKTKEPFAYPNPYYAGAAWQGRSLFAEDAKLIFANLPKRSRIRIFNTAGDQIEQILHDQTYNGTDSRWFTAYSDVEKTVFSGGEHAWDVMSADNQIIARGLYLFTVENLDTGEEFKGKFTIIK